MTQNTAPNIVRTKTVDWLEAAQRNKDLKYRYKELSGEHLGARIEELAAGATSSNHHYHTMEEEHVFMLSGEAVLFFGDRQVTVAAGDHVWFRAGEEIAHHFKNVSSAPCTYLVYGERHEGDVVVYPDAEVMMVKALGFRKVPYPPPQT